MTTLLYSVGNWKMKDDAHYKNLFVILLEYIVYAEPVIVYVLDQNNKMCLV